ncbi:hypothetical protein ACFQZO_23980 [Bradyrhizobium sp. GCM10027634]|uniref:hypothetical protein n=1 Tax=unclassified Bradyrhizobium TaxID=2631580 RepID=UPI00188A9579|nr:MULTISPECIES: hypothetical protein [unclassified Bradyrhizobium]MDN5003900.1 hypothetical protein [Bradyrhizobium sp. WYCCWR 12677]QOZ45438.1 hypothetical protein XH89_19570 [Bradyrhizobium sp. CCBAU 53340]
MDDQIAAAREAWGRICRRGSTQFNDWVLVGHALVQGRAQALKLAGTNRPFGRKYTAAMGLWLSQSGLDQISKAERGWLFRVMDELPAIERWRAGLDDAQRRAFNCPQSIWLHFRRSQQMPTATKPRAAPEKPRPVWWSQDMIRRGADAMRKSMSRDLFVLARACLEAAIRSDADIVELLDKPRSNARPREVAAEIGMRASP